MISFPANPVQRLVDDGDINRVACSGHRHSIFELQSPGLRANNPGLFSHLLGTGEHHFSEKLFLGQSSGVRRAPEGTLNLRRQVQRDNQGNFRAQDNPA